MDLYHVIGNPVAHSKSPIIHSYFAEQTKQSLQYTTFLGDEENFEEQVNAFFAEGGKGLNVTVPFKERAYAMCQSLSKRAQLAGAVNTLMLTESGELFGDNTDGAGMVNDIVNLHGQSVTGKRILIIGAGGAVRGVLEPLLAQQPSSVTIVNRTRAKAELLAQQFDCLASSFEDLSGSFDIIINGSSSSLSGELPPLKDELINANTWCYDMMYSKDITVFLKWAYDHGAKGADGLGMLVSQAAEAFTLWRGVKPDTLELIEQLRSSL